MRKVDKHIRQLDADLSKMDAETADAIRKAACHAFQSIHTDLPAGLADPSDRTKA
jgi:hypothetical protein